MRAIFFLCLPVAFANAFFSGNPEAPDVIDDGIIFSKESDFSIEVGYQKDWVFDMNLKAQNLVDSTFPSSQADFDQGVVRLDFLGHYQVYGSLGSAQFSFNQTLRSDQTISYISDDAFTFGAGGKVLIYQGHGFSLGLDGKYQYATFDLPTIYKQGAFIPQKSAYGSFYGFQLGLSFAYHIDIFSPYIGIDYLFQKVHFQKIKTGVLSNLDNDFYAKTKFPFGGIVGVTLSSGRDFAITVESRFINENAVTLLFDLKF